MLQIWIILESKLYYSLWHRRKATLPWKKQSSAAWQAGWALLYPRAKLLFFCVKDCSTTRATVRLFPSVDSLMHLQMGWRLYNVCSTELTCSGTFCKLTWLGTFCKLAWSGTVCKLTWWDAVRRLTCSGTARKFWWPCPQTWERSQTLWETRRRPSGSLRYHSLDHLSHLKTWKNPHWW